MTISHSALLFWATLHIGPSREKWTGQGVDSRAQWAFMEPIQISTTRRELMENGSIWDRL